MSGGVDGPKGVSAEPAIGYLEAFGGYGQNGGTAGGKIAWPLISGAGEGWAIGAFPTVCENGCTQLVTILQMSLHDQHIKCTELAAREAAAAFVAKHKECQVEVADKAAIECPKGEAHKACLQAFPYSSGTCQKDVTGKYAQACCLPPKG